VSPKQDGDLCTQNAYLANFILIKFASISIKNHKLQKDCRRIAERLQKDCRNEVLHGYFQTLQKNCRRIAERLQKRSFVWLFSNFAERLQKNCRKIAEELQKDCRRIAERKIMKNIQGHYRFDEKTANTIKNKADALGVSQTEYITRLVLSDNVPFEKDMLKKIYRELSAIGNNINQIAHKINMNMYDVADMDRIDEFKKSLFEFKKAITIISKEF